MNLDFLSITYQQGLLIIDVPFDSFYLFQMIQFWIAVFVIRFIVSIFKMIPFL